MSWGARRPRPPRLRAGRRARRSTAPRATARFRTATWPRSAATSATRSATPTSAASSTATSSLRTRSSARSDAGGRRAKLMDFGIAAVAGAPSLTATGEVIGTLAYMAPEQAEGEYAGPEADVYSLALTLYEAWAGENPVARRTPAQTARQIGQPAPSLAELRPDLPEPAGEPDRRLSRRRSAQPADAGAPRSVLDRAALQLDDECAVPSPDGVELPLPRRSFAARLRPWSERAWPWPPSRGPRACPALALVRDGPAASGAVRWPRTRRSRCCRWRRSRWARSARWPPRRPLIALARRAHAGARDPGRAGFAAYLVGSRRLRRRRPPEDRAPAPDGWEASAGAALARGARADARAGRIGLGVAVLAAATVARSACMLRAHPALALVGTMIWAAALAAGLALRRRRRPERKRERSSSWHRGLAVAIEAARASAKSPHAAPLASAQPALHGGG